MILECSFSVSVNEITAHSRTGSFFTLSGYEQTSGSGSLEFNRGSMLGSFTSFNPLKWKCQVEVRISPGLNTEIYVRYNIRSDPFEKSITHILWDEELARLQSYISSGDFAVVDPDVNTKRIKNYVFRLIGLPAGLFLAAVLGVVAGILAGTSGISNLTAYIIGLAVFIFLGTITAVLWARSKK